MVRKICTLVDSSFVKTLLPLENIIKIILAILLFVANSAVPEGYFDFAYLLTLIGFSVLAYKSYQRKEHLMTVVYIVLAVLFQPLLPLRDFFYDISILNIITVGGLLISVVSRFVPPRYPHGIAQVCCSYLLLSSYGNRLLCFYDYHCTVLYFYQYPAWCLWLGFLLGVAITAIGTAVMMKKIKIFTGYLSLLFMFFLNIMVRIFL